MHVLATPWKYIAVDLIQFSTWLHASLGVSLCCLINWIA
jgi:hypothetical protein